MKTVEEENPCEMLQKSQCEIDLFIYSTSLWPDEDLVVELLNKYFGLPVFICPLLTSDDSLFCLHLSTLLVRLDKKTTADLLCSVSIFLLQDQLMFLPSQDGFVEKMWPPLIMCTFSKM